MWRLLRDQIERRTGLIIASVVGVGQAALLVPELGPLMARSGDDLGRLFVRLLFATLPAFLAASLGYTGTLADLQHGGGRAIRILPVRRPEVARALWLGAAIPGLVIGALVIPLVTIVQLILRFAVGYAPAAGFSFLVPTTLAFTLGSAMSVVMWSYLVVTRQLPGRLVTLLLGVLMFQLWYLAWLWAATRFTLLGAESLLIVSFAIGVAGFCLLLCTRLWERWGTERPRAGATVSRKASVDGLGSRGRTWSLVEPWLRTSAMAFGSALIVGVAFLLAIVLYQPLARFFSIPFRLRWMVLVTYAVAWGWFSSWRPALRAFRCLPLLSRRLMVLAIGSCLLIYLAGSLGALAVLALEEEARFAVVELPFVGLLCFATTLFLASLALHVQRSNGVHELFGFGFLVLPNAFFLPTIVGEGIWLAGFTTRVWLWSYAVPAGLLLAALGLFALRYSLILSSAPYRPVPQTERGL